MQWLTLKLGLFCLFVSTVNGEGNVATKSFWRVRPKNGNRFQFGYTMAIGR